jgi:hypothetical protein
MPCPRGPPCPPVPSDSTAGQSSSRLRQGSLSSPCTTRQMVYLPSPEPSSCPLSHLPHPRPTRHHHHPIRRIRRPPLLSAQCHVRPLRARSRICKVSSTRTSAPLQPPPQETTMWCLRGRRRRSTVSGAGLSRQMSREVPKPEQEMELEVAVRNRFQCVRHRRLIETACLRGRVLAVWRRTIRVNPGMQVEMIVTVVIVVGAHTGRLWRTADTSVRVVMGLHVMAATMATRSTLHHLRWRIRTRCANYSLQTVSLYFIHHLFSFAIYGSAPRSL